MNLFKFVIIIVIVVLGISFIIDPIDKQDNNNICVSTHNLTYSYYNHTTKEVTNTDSKIPVYNCKTKYKQLNI